MEFVSKTSAAHFKLFARVPWMDVFRLGNTVLLNRYLSNVFFPGEISEEALSRSVGQFFGEIPKRCAQRFGRESNSEAFTAYNRSVYKGLRRTNSFRVIPLLVDVDQWHYREDHEISLAPKLLEQKFHSPLAISASF